MPLIDIFTMRGMTPCVEEHLLSRCHWDLKLYSLTEKHTELDGANLLYAITDRAGSISRSV